MRPVKRIQWASDEQRQFFEAGPSPTLILGGFNAAKTWGGVFKLLRLLDLYPGSRAAVVRSNARHMRKTTMETFFALCPPSAYNNGRRSDQEGILQLNNGSLVYFIHLDKPDSLDVLAGLELNFGFIDQAEQIPEKAVDILDARLGRWAQAKIPQEVLDKYPEWPWVDDFGNRVPPPFLFMTANPPESDDHWLFVRFADESLDRPRWKELGYNFIRADSRTNRFASKANIAKLTSKDPEFVRRFVEGRWGSPEGYIFDISSLSILDPHPDLIHRIIQDMNLHRSLDHGDSSPTCCLWEGTDHDGNIYVYREYYIGDTLVSDHRRAIWVLSKGDAPAQSVYSTPRYRSSVADPSIFSVSRGRTVKSAPTWSIADEYTDTRIMPKETAIYWTPAPIPRTESETYELVTRSRIKEYLHVDPTHRHPMTGQLGAPRLYFIRKTDSYPNGCDFVLRELRAQRRVKIGERDGRAVYSDQRDPNVTDHAYDTLKYHVISRPSPARISQPVDPNSINIRELMDWSARSLRRRVAVNRGGTY